MKIILILSAVLLLPMCLCASDSPAPQFIRGVGTYQIAPKMTLTIATDSSGILRYIFKRPYQHNGSTADVTFSDSLDTAKGGIIFSWDSASETLWYATATRIVAIAPEGGTAYDYSPKSLAHAPRLFQDEARRTFP